MTPAAKIPTPPAKRLRRAVRRLVRAEVAYSWRGALPAEDMPAVVRERTAARKALDKMIEEVCS